MADEKDVPTWTQAGLKKFIAPETGGKYPDPEKTGLYLVITPAGCKTFYLPYRFPRGRKGKQRMHKIGRLGKDINLSDARDRAKVLRGDILKGIDPMGEVHRVRKAVTKAEETAYTVAELCDRFLRDYVDAGKVKHATGKNYRRYIETYIKPAMGALAVKEINGSDVADLLNSMKSGMYTGVKSALSRLFTRAHLWGLRDGLPNPVTGQDKSHHKGREGISLSDAQLNLIGERIRSGFRGTWELYAMVAILLTTGMRVGELVGSKPGKIQQRPWGTVDLKEGTIVIAPEDHKTGKRTGEKTVYLCKEIVAYMKAMQKGDDPSRVLGGWHAAESGWKVIRDELKLTGVVIHDFRHTFISRGDALGVKETTVSKLVGHAAKNQTQKYTHKFSPELAAGAQTIGGHIAVLLGL